MQLRHIDTSKKTSVHDMSSTHHSIIDVDEEHSGSVPQQSNRVDITSAEQSDNYFEDAALGNGWGLSRRKNMFIIVTLLLFIGIAAAIGVAVVFAMNDKPIGRDSGETTEALAGGNEIADEVEQSNEEVAEQDNVTTEIFETSVSEESKELVNATTPSCISLELGIIAYENARMPKWEIVGGSDRNNDESIVWKSSEYDGRTFDSKAMTFKKCLPPQMYTFVFADSDRARSYVLSSEGKLIVNGMSIESNEDIVAFELPFEAPPAYDADGDGIEDRLGTLMPYDSTGLKEGVDCEPLRIELQTDDLGIETLWRLYEGDESGKMIADGGPYASNSFYRFEYCLKIPAMYTFYMYDWASNGLCCTNGNGYYMLSSRGDIIVNATGEIDVSFSLPFDLASQTTFESTIPTPQLPSMPSYAPVFQEKQPKDTTPKGN